MAEYQFVMRTGPFAGKVYPISGDVVTLGREPGNTIVVNDAEISRRHTRLVLQGGVYMIEDLGSTNGTYVNGERLTGPQPLNGGEVISFGEQISCVFEVLGGGDPNATIMHTPRTEVAAPIMQPQKPVYSPPPQPVQSRPVTPPESSFARQIPAGPEPVPPALPKKNNARVIIILALVLVLCIFCACIGFFWWVDSDPTGGRWCDFFPFLVTGFGGVCP